MAAKRLSPAQFEALPKSAQAQVSADMRPRVKSESLDLGELDGKAFTVSNNWGGEVNVIVDGQHKGALTFGKALRFFGDGFARMEPKLRAIFVKGQKLCPSKPEAGE